LIDTSGATIMQATPATWRMLLTAGWQGSARLKAFCGGEALSWDLARDLLGHVDQLWNLYGPTETTIWSAATRVQAEDGRVSLGQPIANTRLYVLDHQQRLLPVGVPGELYIGGDGLARGYLKRPDLTAERFVPDPFSATGYPQGGARLYRTGDLVRYRHDGTIEFFGRIDQQIKLRGYRIELGEIEAVLRQQPEVRDAAVLVREDRPGDQRLVAYLVENQEPRTTEQTEDPGSTSSSSPVPETAMVDGAGSQKGKERTAELLANALRARLPEYMIPSAFVLLDALPLTPNGKLDRKALPAPDRSHSSGDGSFVPPRTPAEEMIAGVWSATLGVERVGVHDNFFALGGHSLMATQVVSRLKQVMNLDLPLRLLFEAPTVAAFATRLAAQQADNSIPLRAVSRDGAPLPLSFAQQRMWFLDRLQPNSAAYNLLTVARLRGTVDLQAVQRSLTASSARHESLRTSFAEQRGEPVQIIHPVADVPLPLISLRDQPAEQQQSTLMQIVRAEAERPFDLQQSPLLRAQIVQIDPAEHVLLLTVHHIVSDGWSQGVLLRELAALYQGFVADVPRPEESLPPLPVQYADYAL
jgi:acyl carrier protein